MAERRSFTKDITNSYVFLDLPISSQALYFHLGMEADDKGYIDNPKAILRKIGSSLGDLEPLILKKFILLKDTSLLIYKGWNINEYMQSDIYKETRYLEDLRSWFFGENNFESSKPVETKQLELFEDVEKEESKKEITQRFEVFWKYYPKKQGKQKCLNWFISHKPSKELVQTMISAINEQRKTEKWREENGQYIPMPITWLHQARWEDELEIDFSSPEIDSRKILTQDDDVTETIRNYWNSQSNDTSKNSDEDLKKIIDEWE